MKQLPGVNIKEVWNSRLSSATPLIDRRSGTWVCQVWSKTNPDYDPADPSTLSTPIETHDTGIPHTDGDEYDAEKLRVCFAWFYSVRDKYALPNIEDRKPVVALIEEANATASALDGKIQAAVQNGDGDAVRALRADLQAHLTTANRAIREATADLKAVIAAGGAS